MTTYRELAHHLTALGLLTHDAARNACQDPIIHRHLDTDEEQRHLPGMLHDLGAAVEVHTDDVDVDLAAVYRTILEEAAALSGGSVTVADVRLVDESDGEKLRFTVNGRDVSWSVDHIDPEYLDTLAIATGINDLAPQTAGNPRRFYECRNGDDTGPIYYVLAEPAQAAALEQTLRLTCISMD